MKDDMFFGKYLEALTLVGPTRDNPVLDPLAVLHLDNQLFILEKISMTYNTKRQNKLDFLFKFFCTQIKRYHRYSYTSTNFETFSLVKYAIIACIFLKFKGDL